MRLSAVLVHYRASEAVAAAVASLGREVAAAGLGDAARSEILVVDNGSDPQDLRILEDLPVRRVDAGANLGFAGGLERGVAAAEGEVLLLANPDLELAPGSLGRLLETVESAAAGAGGAAIAGPAFHWDREGRFLLPPAERRDRWSDLLARLAPRGPGWAARGRRRWRRHARRHWRATGPVPSPWLSGALMVATRAAWERVGPLDAGYFLYFEETDWLLRARRRGVPVLHEPRARVLHHYGRSTAGEPRSQEWFRRSEARFEERWYGPLHRRLRRWAAPPAGGGPAVPWPPPLPPLPPGPADPPPSLDLRRLGLAVPGKVPAGELWVELSPSPLGFPATGERLAPGTEVWEPPPDLVPRLEGRWRLALVDGRGRERFRATLEGAPGGTGAGEG